MPAAGSATVTEQLTLAPLKKIKFAWTSDASGNVNSLAAITTEKNISGKIEGLVTIPSGGGTAPTALYDITIKDADGTDVLNGAGADRSATVTEYVQATSLGWVQASTLELNVANAGNAKQGTVYLYVR